MSFRINTIRRVREELRYMGITVNMLGDGRIKVMETPGPHNTPGLIDVTAEYVSSPDAALIVGRNMAREVAKVRNRMVWE